MDRSIEVNDSNVFCVKNLNSSHFSLFPRRWTEKFRWIVEKISPQQESSSLVILRMVLFRRRLVKQRRFQFDHWELLVGVDSFAERDHERQVCFPLSSSDVRIIDELTTLDEILLEPTSFRRRPHVEADRKETMETSKFVFPWAERSFSRWERERWIDNFRCRRSLIDLNREKSASLEKGNFVLLCASTFKEKKTKKKNSFFILWVKVFSLTTRKVTTFSFFFD